MAGALLSSRDYDKPKLSVTLVHYPTATIYAYTLHLSILGTVSNLPKGRQLLFSPNDHISRHHGIYVPIYD